MGPGGGGKNDDEGPWMDNEGMPHQGCGLRVNGWSSKLWKKIGRRLEDRGSRSAEEKHIASYQSRT